MRRQDVIVGVVALAACAVAFGLTFRFTTTTPAAMMSGMGAEFFPRLVLGAMAILAVCILFGVGNPPMDTPAAVPRIVVITVAVLATYIASVELLGMWIASFAVMMVLGRMWGERRLALLAASSAGMLAVVWFVFVRLLKGSFPEGLVARLWS
jgi:hypothetical protein